MNRDPEDFESLQKLLALKRWELPPPAYFHDFPSKLRSRLEADRGVEKQVSWWQWLVQEWELKPILLGAYSVGIGGLLLVGISLSEAVGERPMAAEFRDHNLGHMALTLGPATESELRQIPLPFASSVSSTLNPVLSESPPASELFNGSRLMVQPATFKVEN
jgi:hypothetical protein